MLTRFRKPPLKDSLRTRGRERKVKIEREDERESVKWNDSV